MEKHSIIVGGLGCVYSGTYAEARRIFEQYKSYAQEGVGRAAGDSVTWMQGGEIYEEYIGTADEDGA